MIFDVIDISEEKSADIDTEIKFAVATAKADNIEVLRFDIKREEDILKNFNIIIRILKKMKTNGQIQFIATPNSFDSLQPEAAYLLNKYPEISGNIPGTSETTAFVYVKI